MLVDFAKNRIVKIQLEENYSNQDLYNLGLNNNKDNSVNLINYSYLNEIR